MYLLVAVVILFARLSEVLESFGAVLVYQVEVEVRFKGFVDWDDFDWAIQVGAKVGIWVAHEFSHKLRFNPALYRLHSSIDSPGPGSHQCGSDEPKRFLWLLLAFTLYLLSLYLFNFL